MNACTPHSTHPALSRLTDRSLLRTLGHIGGRWTAAPDAADFTVTDPASGALHFSKTLDEHNAAVAMYRPLWEEYDKSRGLN